MTEHHLCATNTRFMSKPNKLWTFQYTNGSKAQLDYILVRKKWVNSIKNSREYPSFNSVLSDHKVVSAKIKLSLRTQSKEPGNPMNHVDWKLVTRTLQMPILSQCTTGCLNFVLKKLDRVTSIN